MENGLTIRIPARFASAGQFVAQPGWTHPRRVLDTTVLIVVECGRFGLTVDGRAHVLGANQALLLPAGLAHGGFRCDGEAPARYYWAHFEDGQGAGGQALRLGLEPINLTDIAFSRVANGFHQLLNENSLPSRDSLLCDYMLSLILLELQREGQADAEDRRDQPNAGIHPAALL